MTSSTPSSSSESALVNRIHFPRIRKIHLSHFTLYSSKPSIRETVNSGVFCLVGANGLGKSTFIAALNFALTGLVADPKKKYQSTAEFLRHNSEFAQTFFDGRIEEKDREDAQVSIEMEVGTKVYFLTRGIFDEGGLRELTIRPVGRPKTDLVETQGMSDIELRDAYEQNLTEDLGLATFDQFVFLQHFVLTFDEQRNLLLWDKDVLETALYLAFGVDHNTAKKADTLRRDIEKADSRVRNYNWQASEVLKKAEELRTASGNGRKSKDLVEIFKKLHAAYDASTKKVEGIEVELKDVTFGIAGLVEKQRELKTEYSEEFNKRLNANFRLANHPLVRESIAESECKLCGTAGKAIRAKIQERTESSQCPLCESPRRESKNKAGVERLRALDKAIASISVQIDQAADRNKRLQAELAKATKRRTEDLERLSAFESTNDTLMIQIRRDASGDVGIQELLTVYERQARELLAQKDEHKRRRESTRAELRRLQNRLTKNYTSAEEAFVPLFQDLATEFLGLDISISLDTKARVPGVRLVLEVRSTTRRHQYQLSESQRFFLDIAFRMALVQYMSSQNDKGTMLIDTPEGSLDIAYEHRAGVMLSKHVQAGFPIIMTANINTSRLIQSMAAKLGAESMHVHRMTSWSQLSEVQLQESKLFEEAYDQISNLLTTGGTSGTKGSGKRKAG